jgi:hypothetical protein
VFSAICGAPHEDMATRCARLCHHDAFDDRVFEARWLVPRKPATWNGSGNSESTWSPKTDLCGSGAFRDLFLGKWYEKDESSRDYLLRICSDGTTIWMGRNGSYADRG